jgi:hypothetical protein
VDIADHGPNVSARETLAPPASSLAPTLHNLLHRVIPLFQVGLVERVDLARTVHLIEISTSTDAASISCKVLYRTSRCTKLLVYKSWTANVSPVIMMTNHRSGIWYASGLLHSGGPQREIFRSTPRVVDCSESRTDKIRSKFVEEVVIRCR